MSTYLLLRNNKETGPFTMEEIKDMSLKSYDLVWTVGKSAAWRYPGEITEFKSFAPAVPEQSGDLFLTKKNTENISSDPLFNKKSESQNQKNREGNFSRSSSTHSVYVNLPAEKKPAAVSSAGVLFDSDLQSDHSSSYDFSDIYSKKPSRVVRVSGRLIWIFSILLLFGTGIVTGFFISDRRKFFTSDANHPQKDAGLEPAGPQTRQKISPADAGQVSHASAVDPTGGPNPALQSLPLVRTSTGLGKRNQKNTAKKDSLTLNPLGNSVGRQTDTSQKQTLVSPTELLSEKVKANPENYVDLATGHFSTGLFGGISAVPITVTNNAPVVMDLVAVTISYIQSNDKVFKTEDIIFNDLEPGETLTEKAPKSPRGVKITTRIRQITCHKLDLNYSK
jgi:hypothetical protein